MGKSNSGSYTDGKKMMVDIYIYGAGNNGKILYERIKAYYAENIRIKAFIDKNKDKKKFNDNLKIISMGDTNERGVPVVIAIESRYVAREVYAMLKKNDFRNVYFYLNRQNPKYNGSEFLENECIKLIADYRDILPHIEMHAVDYCNLNCKACIHYSPLFSKEEHDNALIYKDIASLSKITRSIMSFYIMGGEPLLRDDLGEVVKCARKTFPDSDIQILTNGLLISEKLSDLWDIMRKCNVSLTVSEYEPTYGRTINVKSILESHGVPYIIRPYKEKQSFIKTLSLFKDARYPRTCICNGCVNVYNRKVARCPAVMYISRLNETFSIGLPKHGIYELKDFGNAEELYKKMKERIPLCDHCYNYEIEWQQCKKERNLSDFVIVDE